MLLGDAIILDMDDDLGEIDNNSFTYKNFDLNFFITGVQGNDVVNLNNWESANPNQVRGNKAAILLDGWFSKPG